MKQHEKFIDENGQETTEDKAVVALVSIYDDEGAPVEERIRIMGREKSLDSDAEAE